MDLKLVYALVPKDGTINDLIQKKAGKLAQKIPGMLFHEDFYTGLTAIQKKD